MHPLLKDTLELFLEFNYMKSILRKSNLSSDQHKICLRQCLILICAICGPDPETEPVKTPATFHLDLTRLKDDDYHADALLSSLKWCSSILDQMVKKGRKEIDLIKKINSVIEEYTHFLTK